MVPLPTSRTGGWAQDSLLAKEGFHASRCRLPLSSFFPGCPPALFAAGFAHDENFIVYAPDQDLADRVLAKAEEFRKAEAKNLLGAELEPGKGRTIITVEVSASEDSGFTWPIDCPRAQVPRDVADDLARAGGGLDATARNPARRAEHALPGPPAAVDRGRAGQP